MTFEEASLLPRSEKITLVTMESEKLAKLFTLDTGFVYYKDVDNFVSGVNHDGVALVQAPTYLDLSEGEFFFDITARRLYVWLFNDADPVAEEIGIVYRFFFSNAPLILPYDLDAGEQVEWHPYIEAIDSIGQQLDDENTGIVLETRSAIKLINSDGFFDEIYDTLIWENKSATFYTWFPITPITEVRQIFDGVIESKDYDSTSVTFKVKDFIYRLRDFVDLDLFSDVDGDIAPSIIDTPKRRIYGQVKQARMVGIDNILDGFTMTGTGSIAATPSGTNASIIGTGTLFLSELSPGDELIFNISGTEYKFGVEEVLTDTTASLNKNSPATISSQPILNNPEIPYRRKNRLWHLAGHRIREPITSITSVISNNRFEVLDTADIFADDVILVDDILTTVRRVSGNEIVTDTAISPIPSSTDSVVKIPIQNVYFGKTPLVYARDWTYLNFPEAIVQVDITAEFNITQERLLGVSVTFTSGSRVITTTASVDFRSILKPRDWIKKNTITSGQGDWYEVLQVKEQEITLRIAYGGSTSTTTALFKAVEYINDDSILTANCLGMEVNDQWIRTPAQAVRHLILNDAAFSSVNEESFTQADANADYTLSVIVPESIGSNPPPIRDVITKINESVFGSLYGDSSNSISYSILNATKPELTSIIKDDDIISFSSDTTTEIYNEIRINYRPYYDFFANEDAFEFTSYNSGFVDKHIGIKANLEKTVYLYKTEEADTIAQRYALFKSMSNTRVTLKGKMNFFLTSVNDKIFLSLDRIFKRLGGGDRLKIGIVTSTKKSQTETELVLSDLGNVYNRVPSIAPDTEGDYSAADSTDKVRWGYIVDNDTLTPDITSEENLGNNIIG